MRGVRYPCVLETPRLHSTVFFGKPLGVCVLNSVRAMSTFETGVERYSRLKVFVLRASPCPTPLASFIHTPRLRPPPLWHP